MLRGGLIGEGGLGIGSTDRRTLSRPSYSLGDCRPDSYARGEDCDPSENVLIGLRSQGGSLDLKHFG